MIRPYRSPVTVSWYAGLLGMLWLSGCAAPSPQGQHGSADLDQAVKYNVELGVAYMSQGNLARAQTKLDKALDIDPGHAGALQAQALLYQYQGETGLAGDYFKRALNEDADFTRARNNYAAFLYARGQVHDACAQLQRATDDIHYPQRAQLFTNLGKCQRELGHLDLASQSLQRAQAIDPRHAQSYMTLAKINLARGDTERAWKQLQTFIRLAGSTPESVRLAEQIASADNVNLRRLETSQGTALTTE